MKRIVVLMLSLFMCSSPAWAAEHAPKTDTAIVIAAFGSTYPEGRKSLFDLQQAIQAKYPELPVSLAFTAAKVRARIFDSDARTPSLESMLTQLSDEGYKRVAVVSAHIIPGMEYQDVLSISAAVQDLPKGLTKVSASLPLIASDQEADLVADALRKAFPQGQEKGKAVLFVGHGTHGPGSLAYPALAWALQQAGPGTYFVSSIESEAGMTPAIELLQKSGAKEVTIVPLMTVAGDHANNDILGKEDDSYSSVLKAKGFTVREHNNGLGSLPSMQAIWISRLQAALDNLDNE